MIVKLNPITEAELDQLMKIWLTSNQEAHSFIAEVYWKENIEAVKLQLPESELYGFKNSAGQIVGFVGIVDHYLAGIFVEKNYRGQGIGEQLIRQAKSQHPELSLSVYKKNRAAIKFYRAQGFTIVSEQVDAETLEVEYKMSWVRK